MSGADSLTESVQVNSVLERRLYQPATGASLPYRLACPAAGTRDTRYPLLVFLHGAGERGTDNEAQTRLAVGDIARHTRDPRHRCFVVAPQCPPDDKWADVEWGDDAHAMGAEPTRALRTALDLVDQLCRELPIDRARLYLAGISMGGYGVWDAVCRYPKRFAAAVPVCGGGDEHQAHRLVGLPLWAFHGALDRTVKPVRSRTMIAAIRAAGGDPRYTEYPHKDHDSWVPAFTDPALYKWLFAQRRPAEA
ncbi:MAG: phospholipase [Chitinivibrionales bacterium]|nr:phospholipase [Chitinivibrionales bacterium]